MNRFSRAREYSKPVSPFDMDFIGKAMAYKQNKVDANKALIQDTIDNIMSLTIDKPEAREYLYGRVEKMVNSVNAYSGSDLSNDGVARNISSYINNAVDDVVLNAYAGSMEGRRMEQYYDQLMRDDPERYNERNKAFDMAPYYRWQNDGKAGSRLAPLQVSKYVDYKAESENVLKQMREAQKNGMEWQYPDPDNHGYYITKKIDRMTPDEVQQAVYNSLGQDARKQIFIDGWYMANTQPQSFTPEALNQYVSGINGDYDRSKAVLRAQMAGSVGNSEKYDELRRSYDLIDERRTAFNNKARQIFSTGNIEEMGAFMVENNLLRSMGQTWSYDRSSSKMETDPSYWSKMNYERNLANDQVNVAKIAADIKLKEERLALDKQRAASKIALDQSEIEINRAKAAAAGGGAKIDYANAGVVADVELNTKEAPFSAQDYVQARINTYKTDIQTNASDLVKDLTPENREAINAWVEEAKASNDPEYAGLSDEEMVVAYFDNNGGAANDMLTNGSALDYYSRIKDAQVQMDVPMEVIREYDAYQNEVLSEAPSVIADYAVKNGGVPTVAPDGSMVVSDEVGGKEVANALALEYLDEVFGTSFDVGTTVAPQPGYGLKIISSIDAKKASEPAMANLLSKIGEYNGERVSFSDVFVDSGDYGWIVRPKEEGEPYTTTMMRSLLDYKISKDKRDSTNGNVMQTALGMALGPAVGGIVSSVANNTVNRNSNRGSVKNLVKRASDPKVFADMANEYVKVRTPKAVLYSKGDKDTAKREAYTKLSDLYLLLGTADSYGNALKRFQVAKIPAPDAVTLQENIAEDGSLGYLLYVNGDPSNGIPISPMTLAQNDITMESRTMIETKALKKKTAKVSLAAETNKSYSKYLVENQMPGMASKMEIMNTLLDSHPNIFRKPSEDPSDSLSSYVPTEMGEEAVALAQNIDKFMVGTEGYTFNGVPGVKVYIYDAAQKDANKTPIYQYTIDDVPYANETVKRLSTCPQYFVMKGLDLVIAEYEAGLRRGTQAGKENWNRIMNVVRKK